MKISFFLILLSLFLIFPPQAKAIDNPQSLEITVSATIGEPKLTLFGYTSPHALVQLEGQRVSEQVIADLNGYFFFDRIFLPYPHPQYPELCLNSIDTQSRISFPTCLPSLPIGPFNLTIGPVLLSPTLSLEKGNFLPNEQITAKGLTIPNSEVAIFLANDSSLHSRIANLKLVSQAQAYTLPQYKTKADQNGNFEFNLPTVKRANWKIFAGATFQNSPTPKSNTLSFKIQSWWEWFWNKVVDLWKGLIRLLKPFWWLIVILVELIVVTTLLVRLKKRGSNQVRI